MAQQKKFYLFGMIGCLCFGIGDWLLGYVNPLPAKGDVFYFIRAGHGADYHTLKAVLSLALAAFGMCFLYPGFVHISDIVKDRKRKRFLGYAFGLCAIGWLMLHIMVSVNVFVFSEAGRIGGYELAIALSNRLGSAGSAVVCCAYLFVAAALLLLVIDIMHGDTSLTKCAVLFSPAVWMVLFVVVSLLLPQSAFSYGLYTFCMNGGMIVWFVYLLANGS